MIFVINQQSNGKGEILEKILILNLNNKEFEFLKNLFNDFEPTFFLSFLQPTPFMLNDTLMLNDLPVSALGAT